MAASLDGPKISQAAGVDSLARIIVYGGKDLDNGDWWSARPYDAVEGFRGETADRDEAWPVAYFAWASDEQRRLYAFGGNDGEGGPTSPHASRYDATTNSWHVLAPMTQACSDAAATCDLAGRVHVVGGLDATGTARTGNVATYDIAANSWSDTTLPDLPVPTSGHRAVLGADNRLYVLGGEIGSLPAGVTTSTTWTLNLNNPSTGWVSGPAMAVARQHFGAVLDVPNSRIVVMGGENDAGGTSTCESLFTPLCPTITWQPSEIPAWRGTVARFALSVGGSPNFSYQWRRNGASLQDGPTGTGSEVEGSGEAVLSIYSPDDGDLATYDVVVTNECGSVTSAPMSMTLRTPPNMGTRWQVTNLHPSWIDGPSAAHGVADGRIVGAGTTPVTLPDGRTMSLARPLYWSNTAAMAIDLTPPGSVGGAIRDVRGGLLVGWFWHIWSCYSGGRYWTCGWESAGSWDAETFAFTERHTSGAEFDTLVATDGFQMVGTATHDASGGAHYSTAEFRDVLGHSQSLHPQSASHSAASAVDGGFQYGLVYTPYPAPVARAARWSGTAASFVDLHPEGYANSSIAGASDGQAVGSVGTPQGTHAALWSLEGASFVDLHPAGADSSSVSAAAEGIQVGLVGNRAALWLGTPMNYLDLGAAAGAEFSSTVAYDIEVASDLSITVVGSGFSVSRARQEALVWRSMAACVADVDDGSGAGTPDGGTTIDDLLYYLRIFEGGHLRADVDDGSGTGSPDGGVTIDDLLYYLLRFEIGC